MLAYAEAVFGFVEEWNGPDADENGRGANSVQPEPALSAVQSNLEEEDPTPVLAHEDPAPTWAGGKHLHDVYPE